MEREFVQLDVFAARPGDGNPLAVVLEADGLDDDAMQAIARWTRLPETTFVLPPSTPDASYRLRIFSPRREVPFAGHPSIGSAHAVLDAGRRGATAGWCRSARSACCRWRCGATAAGAASRFARRGRRCSRSASRKTFA